MKTNIWDVIWTEMIISFKYLDACYNEKIYHLKTKIKFN